MGHQTAVYTVCIIRGSSGSNNRFHFCEVQELPLRQVSGIRWSNDRNTFFSVGKDGALLRHGFANAEHLINSVSPIATDINPYGRLATAVRSNQSCGPNNPREDSLSFL